MFSTFICLNFVFLLTCATLSTQFRAAKDISEISQNLDTPCNLVIVFDTLTENLDMSQIRPELTVTIVKSWSWTRTGYRRRESKTITNSMRKIKPGGHICTFSALYFDHAMGNGLSSDV